MLVMPYLFVRSYDLRHMRYSQVDLDRKEWFIQPKKGQHRGDMVDELIIPLSDTVVQKIKNIQSQSISIDKDPLVFGSPKNPDKPKTTLLFPKFFID